MRVEMVTREDLELFRLELVRDLREILQSSQQQSNNEWLKNTEVMKLLKVSANTVQRLRLAGKLRSSRIGGIHYYRYQDIQFLLESGL